MTMKVILTWKQKRVLSWVVFNAICNNISVLWRSDVLVEKTEYHEKTNDLSPVTDTLDYIILYQVHLAMSGIQTHYARYIVIKL